jgi:hypothetical protein
MSRKSPGSFLHHLFMGDGKGGRFLTRGDKIRKALHLIHYVTTKMDWGW